MFATRMPLRSIRHGAVMSHTWKKESFRLFSCSGFLSSSDSGNNGKFIKGDDPGEQNKDDTKLAKGDFKNPSGQGTRNFDPKRGQWIQKKEKSFKGKRHNKNLSVAEQLLAAAKNITDNMDTDRKKTTDELLRVLKIRNYRSSLQNPELNETWMGRKKPTSTHDADADSRIKRVEASETVKDFRVHRYERESRFKQKSHLAGQSVSEKLLSGQKNQFTRKASEHESTTPIEEFEYEPIEIRQLENSPHPNTPPMETWNVLKQRELKLKTTHYPKNALEEMILWTEEGKLWKFPIDNEQGMEEEQNVHFSEHIFLDRHLEDWCPKLGPIRHFMELVCIGLSKNPYLTVQEKLTYITWYKHYFLRRTELWEKLGIWKMASGPLIEKGSGTQEASP